MDIAIYRTDLLDVGKENPVKLEGIGRLNPYNSEATRPWALLERIGLSSISINYNYTGKFPLFIRRGGIINIKELGKLPIIMELEADAVPDEIRFRHPKYKHKVLADLANIKQARKANAFKSSSTYAREMNTLFKTNVYPAIRIFAPDCGDSFKLHLHYADRRLRKINLEY